MIHPQPRFNIQGPSIMTSVFIGGRGCKKLDNNRQWGGGVQKKLTSTKKKINEKNLMFTDHLRVLSEGQFSKRSFSTYNKKSIEKTMITTTEKYIRYFVKL